MKERERERSVGKQRATQVNKLAAVRGPGKQSAEVEDIRWILTTGQLDEVVEIGRYNYNVMEIWP